MKRQVSIEEIWDGRFYGPGDMVKAGCGECSGCSDCCRGMGKTIILDPLDIYRLTEGLHTDFQQLIGSHLELNVVDGVILPNLLEAGAEEVCTFLNKEGRCSIHSIRPGVCRLFPMGRYYEGGSFRYFLQAGECQKEPKTKVKLKKWLDTRNFLVTRNLSTTGTTSWMPWNTSSAISPTKPPPKRSTSTSSRTSSSSPGAAISTKNLTAA